MSEQTPPLAAAQQNGQPAEPARQPFAVKLYAKDPHGFYCEISVAENARPVGWITTMIDNLLRQKFEPVNPYVPASAPPAAPATEPRRGGGRPQQQPRGCGRGGGSQYNGEVYEECPWCGADVYDNRARKQRENWKGPWFKCKSDCGFVVFKNDGTPND